MIKAAKKALDRRSFLRSMPAVPLAAPSIAAEAAKSLGGGRLTSGSMLLSAPTSGSPGTSIDWLAEEKRRLTAMAAGKFDEGEELGMRPDRRLVAAYHYDSLRSLSPVMRAHLHAEHNACVERQNRQSWAVIELKRLFSKN